MDIKDFAKEAMLLKEVNTENGDKQKPAARQKPSVTWELEIAAYPDIIIRKEQPTITKYLAIMPSVAGYYIKTVNKKNGEESVEPLTGDGYAKFTASMPEIKLPEDYWCKSLASGKKVYEGLFFFLGDRYYLDMIKNGAFKEPVEATGYDYKASRWRNTYRQVPKLWVEFCHSNKASKLLQDNTAAFCILTNRFGLENMRDFLREFEESLIENKYSNDFGPLELCDPDTLNEMLTNYAAFKQYVLYESVRMGFALNLRKFIEVWRDTLYMQKKIYRKIKDRYPKDLLTQHQILSYKCILIEEQIEMEKFAEQVDIAKMYEANIGSYVFIAPETRDDFNDEAVQQANCVASYIKRFTYGECLIFFMRNRETPDKSYITIEVRNGKVVQARRKFNQMPSNSDWEVIRKWEEDVLSKGVFEWTLVN